MNTILILAILPTIIQCIPDKSEEPIIRDSKVLPIFQVVRFPNDVCTGTSYNGTCYTAEECSSKGGTNDGTCASGFGVCCTFALTSCGSTSSDNNSYIVKSSFTSLTNPCWYKICPCSTNICRIRYDFNTFTLAAQKTATAATTAAGPAGTLEGEGFSVGQCRTDSFQIAAPGGHPSPTICGPNKGQHMILDSDGNDCQIANFNIGTATTSTRAWSIRVTQYACGDEDSAGPMGCLQYFSATAGTFASYGFPTGITSSSTSLGFTVTHLNDQIYDICIRRASGYCYICYQPIVTASTTTSQASFGVSNTQTGNDDDDSATDTDCLGDYIEIPQAEAAPTAAITTQAINTAGQYSLRQCGRFLAIASGIASNPTICSKQTPFRVGVHFDNEETCISTSQTTANCEWNIQAAGTAQGGAGIVGFKLLFWQNSC